MKPYFAETATVIYARRKPYPPGRLTDIGDYGAVLHMRDLVVVIASVTVRAVRAEWAMGSTAARFVEHTANYYMCLTTQGIVYIYDYDLHSLIKL